MKHSPWPLGSVLAGAALLFTAGSAQATVTLHFSTSTIFATNWANASGAGGQTLAWGIVIDTTGDGFEASYSSAGVSFETPATLQTLKEGTSLPEGGALSDDVMFLAPIVMSLTSNPNDSGQIGLNRISAIAAVPMGVAGISQGDTFAIVWFNRTVLSGSPQFGEAFGIFGDAAFLIPADGNTVTYTAPFVGADPLKPMNRNFDIVPEPATGLLGLLGAVGLLRRRRRL